MAEKSWKSSVVEKMNSLTTLVLGLEFFAMFFLSAHLIIGSLIDSEYSLVGLVTIELFFYIPMVIFLGYAYVSHAKKRDTAINIIFLIQLFTFIVAMQIIRDDRIFVKAGGYFLAITTALVIMHLLARIATKNKKQYMQD